MQIELLSVPDCPHLPLARQRIAEAIDRTGIPQPDLIERVINDPDEAAAAGMHGSPTILINGVDHFASGDEASISCRLYPTPDGVAGAPSVEDLATLITSEIHG